MHDEVISVIVPCYNVEKYVSKCIESIINQTYKNLEIILIDDNSTDKTYEILEIYKEKDNRIKLLKNDINKGAAYSRNRALNEAKGKYIGFVDSDDYIDSNFYEVMIDSILKNNSDISICDFKIVYEDKNKEIISKCFDGEEFNLINTLKSGLVASSSNKLFKKELIVKYRYPEGIINEDIPVVIPSLVSANNISYVANTNYYYIQREKSVQNSSFSEKKFDVVTSLDMALERIRNNKNYEEIKDILVYNQIINLLLYQITMVKGFIKRKRILKQYSVLVLKYNLLDNKSFKSFIDNLDKLHARYYVKLLALTVKERIFCANLLIWVHSILSFFYKNYK